MSAISKEFRDVSNGIRFEHLPIQCGSGTNEAEVGGRVMPATTSIPKKSNV